MEGANFETWDCECGQINSQKRGRCGKCGRLRPAARLALSPADKGAPRTTEGQFGFLRLLIGLYTLTGWAALLGAAFFGYAATRGASERLPSIMTAILCVMTTIVALGLAEAGRVLLVIEERTRPR